MRNSIKTPPLSLPLSVWALSLGFFFLNFSSVIAFGCSPILMRKEFGLESDSAGRLEGSVEAFALIVRSLTGIFSDMIARRKIFLLWGYGISVFSRFLLTAASSIGIVVTARFIEKFGNGIQASPREAFVSDVSPTEVLGRAYGLNKALGQMGSLLGSCAMLVFAIFYRDSSVRALLWGSSCCAILSVIVIFFVKEPISHGKQEVKGSTHARFQAGYSVIAERLQIIFRDFQEFPSSFWKTLLVICLFKLGYFSGTFLMQELNQSGINFFGLSLKDDLCANAVFLIIQGLACSLFSYPLGKLSDVMDRRWSVSIGFALMVLSLTCFAYKGSGTVLYLGTIFYGLQMGMQGSLMALLSSVMPKHLHGTGFGIYFFTSGLAIFFTNLWIMGPFAAAYGKSVAFLFIAACVLLAMTLLPWINPFNPHPLPKKGSIFFKR